MRAGLASATRSGVESVFMFCTTDRKGPRLTSVLSLRLKARGYSGDAARLSRYRRLRGANQFVGVCGRSTLRPYKVEDDSVLIAFGTQSGLERDGESAFFEGEEDSAVGDNRR